MRAKHPLSTGSVVFLPLQLDDLSTIRATANAFLSAETRLDVLWNNAGVMVPPQGSVTAQGHELQLGINNLGHFLLTSLLMPVLRRTAQEEATPGSVRVVWVSSSAADAAPHPAVDFENINYSVREEGIWQKYARSKAGCQLHASELARRSAGLGILSLVSPPALLVWNAVVWAVILQGDVVLISPFCKIPRLSTLETLLPISRKTCPRYSSPSL